MTSLIRVINLDKRPERLNNFYKSIDVSKLDKTLIRKFSAIDGHNLINDIKMKGFENDPIFEVLRNLDISVPKGELGCLLSHYFVLREIQTNGNLNDNDYVLIFEDDVHLTNYDETTYFEHIDEFINTNDVDFIFVSGRWKPHFIPKSMNFFERKSKHFFKRVSGQGHDWDRCAPAYICTKKGAIKMCERVLAQFKDNRKWIAIDNIYSIASIDLITYDFFPHIYYSVPDYQTDIQGVHLKSKINLKELVF